jgi:aspartyl protease family protein
MANKKHTLRIGQNAVSNTGSAQRAEAILTADRQGHFLTNGTINGKSVRFMVDTGASKIGISRNEAERLGLDLRRGEHGMISTANGVAEAVTIKLDRVVIGGITLRNVDAIVSPQPMPFILLGMSFLNYTNMQREGNTLILKQRF